MESQVEEIKKKLDIVDVIGKYLPIKKRGHHFICNCPFHSEKTPSFTVSQELQIFKCFGCGKAGDIFTFLQEYDHIDFKDALEELAKMAGVVLKKDPLISQAELHHKRLIDLNQSLCKFYHYLLTQHPLGKPALDYVLNRGITLATIKQFKIGFSPPNSLLATNYLKKLGFTVDEMIATGTFGFSQYHQGQLYDRFQDRLVFPLADFRDRVLGFSGRIMPQAKNPNLAKYINSPETDIYHKSHMLFGLNLSKESIKKTNSVIVVEGEFDMISPFQSGVTNIVAIKGTAFTQDQLQLLRRYTDTLILGLDSDFAGSGAAQKSIELADSLEFDIQVLDLGDRFKDPDEAVRGDLPFFKNQLAHTLPVWDFIINSALKKFDSTTPKGKREILSTVLPFLVKITNSVIRADYFQKLASVIGSTPQSIVEESTHYFSAQNPKPISSIIPPIIQPKKIDQIDRLEEYLLTLILSARKPHLLAQKVSSKVDFSVPRFKLITLSLVALKSDFIAADFAATLSPELKPVFESLFLTSSYLNLEPQLRQVEVQKTVNLILDKTLHQQLLLLSTQIAQAENTDNQALVEQLEAEYNQVLARLSQIQVKKR